MREYLAYFNEATIKVVHPNQEMFVGAFQNGLRAGTYNECLTQRLTPSLEEVVTHGECYIKGEERNAENKARDVKEQADGNSDNTIVVHESLYLAC